MSLRLYYCGLFAMALGISLASSGCQVPQRMGQNELNRHAAIAQQGLLAAPVERAAGPGQSHLASSQSGAFDPQAMRLSDPRAATSEPAPSGSLRQAAFRASSALKAPLRRVSGEISGFDEVLSSAADDATETEVPVFVKVESPAHGILDVSTDQPSPETPTEDHMPIDLPTVLRLAGMENWGVRLAYERIAEAEAELDRAELLWVPSVSVGLGYNKHEGQIQATEGDVIDVSRHSLFAGGGAAVQNSPLTGGAGGPARLFVDLSLAEAYFQPLVQCQLLSASRFGHVTAFNDTLLEASLAYFELARAQANTVVAKDNLEDAQRVETLTRQFVASGKGSESELSRVLAEVEKRRRDVVAAELEIQLASAELARILQLDPTRLAPQTPLYAADDRLAPLSLISDAPVGELIAQAQRYRPELADRRAQIQARYERVRLEEVRPFVPNLYVGASGGGFGGGRGSDMPDFTGRGDFDIAAVWKLDNLGFGNHAAVDLRESQYRQAILEFHRVRDRVSTDVIQSYHAVQAARKRIELARENVNAATESLEGNLRRIRGLAGLPIEVLQSVTAVSEARQAYVAAVIDSNQAQLRLLRATGQPMRP